MGGVEVSPWSLPGASRRYLMEREKSRRWEAVEMAKGGWAGTGRKSTRAAPRTMDCRASKNQDCPTYQVV